MRRLSSLCFALLLGLTAGAVDRVSWEITPRVTAPGQPFRLQIIIESDVILGGAQQAGKEIRPPRGMALRLSGQIVRSDSNEATINYSGVAPDQEGVYIIPAFNLRFARKVIAVEPIKLTVSNSVAYRRTAQARAELVIPDRTFYVGELIRGSILMRGGEEEAVVASFGLESMAESFSLAVTGDRQPLPEALGQGMQTTFELTPIREGVSELALNGTMLIQGVALNPFSNSGRDRPFAFRRKLTVAHVPERGRPADWSGAIGTFAAEAVQVSKDKPEVGEPIRLRAILTGTGNLDRLITPELPSNEQWDILPAQERRRSSEAQRFFAYTLVPRLPGKLLTPAIRFSTFDPLTKQYSRIEFKPIEVTVTGNAPAKVDLITADPAAPAGLKQKTVRGLAPPEHERLRTGKNRRPVVRKGRWNKIWLTSSSQLDDYIKRRQKAVGIHKGGWAVAGLKLGMKFSDYVTRNSKYGSYKIHSRGNIIGTESGNKASGIVEFNNKEKILANAVQARTRDITKRLTLAIKGTLDSLQTGGKRFTSHKI